MNFPSVKLAAEGQLATVAIGDVETEAGAVIEDVHIAYRRWGDFYGNPHGKNNLILVEHALTGDSNAVLWWEGLIGPGMALDTDKFCVLCTNVLGGCQGSTGPSSDHPDGGKWGSRFPATSVRDQVRAEQQFLETLGISSMHAVIGGSMGGARALEWTLMYPDWANYACVIAVSARASAWQIGIQTSQIHAILRDSNWQGGDYYGTGRSPDEGLAAARRLAHLTYRGELEIDERFGTMAQPGENPLGSFRSNDQRFAVQGYLDHQGKRLVERFDAGSYVAITEALNRYDIGRGRGGLNRALHSSQVPTMVVGVDTDILYPFHQQEHISRNLGNLLAMNKIVSPVGHDAFLVEARQMHHILSNFIALADQTPSITELATHRGNYDI
ncbi:homoserine O-acetyltransferase MetX [Corynebacterium aquatimens]|uniref:Homoserine O-acetyltransferase n=1 Tax=Corynebacterium aquatimens TaxID=1190508 RepID=A0A931E1N4_9CORY|nr:homoserine O-acetyltransferase [Corynebacterium aquatimens]MBG6123094.1 homoserine O-acetyltransferase [Corynebacterium aquatimens]WJY66573.1 Homoserine O-acetyltransferase [Corynebacterium aquatimens]